MPMILAILFFLVQLMEASFGAGTGEIKKDKVIAAIKELFNRMSWNMPFDDKTIGMLIDWLVWIFNTVVGFFQKPASTASATK
ncbi:MAG: hypothetical protein AB2L14_25210 [Candidatus Xenobiia bacterium LiM19]